LKSTGLDAALVGIGSHSWPHGILHHKIWASERAAAAASNNNNNNRKEHLLPTCQLLSTSKKFYKHVIDNIISTQQPEDLVRVSKKLQTWCPVTKGQNWNSELSQFSLRMLAANL
jgi:hypothetical protein